MHNCDKTKYNIIYMLCPFYLLKYLEFKFIFEIPFKGAKIDGDDRTFLQIHRVYMLFVNISNIVVYGLVMLDVLNGDPCRKIKQVIRQQN